MDALSACLRLIDAGLRLLSALDICHNLALFMKYGSGMWTRQRRVDRWRAKKEQRV